MTEILDDNWLEEFFGYRDEEGILKRRESHCIEFKSKFDWGNEKSKSNYCKTLAAFSNNKGGAIFFGVENNPHKLVGIDNFEDVDDADITNYINELFQPAIFFERKLFEVGEIKIGILYAYNHKNRPVICIKDSSKTSSSDIYYRYGAKSTKIKAGEMVNMIQEIKKSESDKWMNLLKNIGEVGIENTHVLNSLTGEIKSDKNTFILDESLLDQIKVIDKYSIKGDGEPALKIIGEIPELARVVKTHVNFYEEDIYNAFLLNEEKGSSQDLLKFICQKNTAYYPFYFLLNRLGFNKEDAIEYLSNLKIRSKVRYDLIERIKNDKRSKKYRKRFSLGDTSKYGQVRTEFVDKMMESRPLEIENEESAQRALESIFSLEKGQYDLEYLKREINQIFQDYYPFQVNTVNYLFRDSLSYIDYLEK
ncbi:MAG: ATP-binding protein [bacterium]|nr:ATP-binding protein [bacterium]